MGQFSFSDLICHFALLSPSNLGNICLLYSDHSQPLAFNRTYHLFPLRGCPFLLLHLLNSPPLLGSSSVVTSVKPCQIS